MKGLGTGVWAEISKTQRAFIPRGKDAKHPRKRPKEQQRQKGGTMYFQEAGHNTGESNTRLPEKSRLGPDHGGAQIILKRKKKKILKQQTSRAGSKRSRDIFRQPVSPAMMTNCPVFKGKSNRAE